MCFGLLLLLVSVPLLWWNESTAVQQFQAIAEVRASFREGGDVFDPALNNKLVYYAGAVTLPPGGGAADASFGVRVPGAIRVTRVSEAFQLVESSRSSTRKGQGGQDVTDTTYSYAAEWRAELVSSASFHDPTRRGANRATWRVPPVLALPHGDVLLGPYTLPHTVLVSLGKDVHVDLTDPAVSSLAPAIAGRGSQGGGPPALGAPVRLSKAVLPVGKGGGAALSPYLPSMSFHGGALYTGDALSPKVGDNRVSFTASAPKTAAVIGKQTRARGLEPYITSNGRSLLLFGEGEQPASALIRQAESEASLFLWALRGGGWLLLVLGYGLTLQPAVAAVGVLPLVGGLLASVAGCGVALAALLAGTITALLVISVAWFWCRPLVSAGLVGAALVLLAASRLRRASSRTEKTD